MIPLYKGKGAGKGKVCGNYRGITHLSSAGKILAGTSITTQYRNRENNSTRVAVRVPSE